MSRARDLADGTFSGAFSADSPTLVVDDTNNLVGIGTTLPLCKTCKLKMEEPVNDVLLKVTADDSSTYAMVIGNDDL